MAETPHRPLVLALAALMAVLYIVAAVAGSWAFFALGLVCLGVVLRLQGSLRFPRLRRWGRDVAGAVANLARFKRPSPRSLRALAVLAGALLVLVILNQLSLAAPGKGRGLSVPMDGFNLGFQGVSSPGGWFAAILSWSLLLGALAFVWYEMWLPVQASGLRPARLLFLACLACFVLAPLLFFLLMAVSAPDEPEANVEFASRLLQRTLIAVAVFVGAASVASHLPGRPAARRSKPHPAG